MDLFTLLFRYITPNQYENGVYAAIRLQQWKLMSETNLFGQAEVNLDLGLVEIGNYRSEEIQFQFYHYT